MPEISEATDAQDRIASLYKTSRSLPDSMLQDYAAIAWFLSDAGRFEAALSRVSERLWRSYRKFQSRRHGAMRNKFSSALRDLGRRYGFGFDDTMKYDTRRVVLVNAIEGEKYLALVRAGVFFKDMMDLKHGEFSHTLQWLCVGEVRAQIGLVNGPSQLYRKIYDMMNKSSRTEIIVPGLKRPGRRAEDGPETGVPLWSWLVDCFPRDMAQGQAIPASESLFSDTYRSPQRITKYLIDDAPSDHFVATYLKYRYKRHNWFTSANQKYADISGTSAKRVGVEKHSNQRWKQVDGYYVRDDQADHEYSEAQVRKMKWKSVTMHDVEGFMADPGDES